MKIRILLTVFIFVFGFSAYGQKKTQKKEVRDSVIFFYGAMELNNGLHVVTPIDSVKVPINKVKQTVFTLNSNNRLRILKFAQNELGDKKLRIKNSRATMILETKGDLNQLRIALDRFSTMNKGGIYVLNKYQFVKPEGLKEGPGRKETVY